MRTSVPGGPWTSPRNTRVRPIAGQQLDMVSAGRAQGMLGGARLSTGVLASVEARGQEHVGWPLRVEVTR